ncbi:MAG: hypothetical protein ABI728_05830 [Betaproteobacteria bacterium]
MLTPEYLTDVAAFSRRYFRDLFARLPEGVTLVLDNYQEVPPEQPLHQLIAQAVGEVPEGMTVIAISRRDPPDAYSRLIANENVALLDWEELKLTLDEANTIGLLRQKLSQEEIARLHEQSGGWAAGLVLMLERLRRGAHHFDAASTTSLREIFDYFATQIVDQSDAVTQRSLLRISYLPQMTASMAIAITGMPSTAALLEDLHRRHLFIDRQSAGIYRRSLLR